MRVPEPRAPTTHHAHSPHTTQVTMRKHSLEASQVLKGGRCGKCAKDIGMYAKHMRCTQCRATFHVGCQSDLLPNCQTRAGVKALKPRPPGTSLRDHVQPPKYVALLVERCIDCVDARGLDTPGIYRESGHAANTTQLKQRFFSGTAPNLRSVVDVREVAGCLKMYFRELDTPITTYELYDAFVGCGRGEEGGVGALEDVLCRLPLPNICTLHVLMAHLQR